MLTQLKHRLAAFMLYHRTVRRLGMLDDRLLRDMGIPPDNLRQFIKLYMAAIQGRPDAPADKKAAHRCTTDGQDIELVEV